MAPSSSVSSFSYSSCALAVFATTFLLLLSSSVAREFLVGGSATAWRVPSSSGALNRWAEANRFQIGDTLVWNLQGENERVVQVSREDYLSCNGTRPLAQSEEATGRFEVELERSGAYYFIDGVEGACKNNGAKVIVVVMAKRTTGFVGGAPASLPVEGEAPALSPEMAVAAVAGLRAGVVMVVGGLIVALLGVVMV